MNNPKYNTFLKYLSSMDIEMLDIILEKDYYSDVPKSLFIEKLEGVFKEFKEHGNTELILHDGKCNSNECNLGKSGYSCVGNVTADHLDLVIEDNLEDIYHCRSFCVNDAVVKGEQIFLNFYEEDKIMFKGTSEHLILLQQTGKAIDELKVVRILNAVSLEYWLNKHQELCDTTGYEPNSKLNVFTTLYNGLTDLEGFLKVKPEAVRAIEEYSLFNPDEEAIGMVIQMGRI